MYIDKYFILSVILPIYRSSIITIPGHMAIGDDVDISFIFVNINFDVSANIELLSSGNKNKSFTFSFKKG